jgi:hypothetical protein
VIEFDILFPGLIGTWVDAIDDRGLLGTSLVEEGATHVVVWTAR